MSKHGKALPAADRLERTEKMLKEACAAFERIDTGWHTVWMNGDTGPNGEDIRGYAFAEARDARKVMTRIEKAMKEAK